MMMGAEQLWLYWLRSNNKVGSDKRRWRGLLIVNCTCNLLGAEHTLDCDSMLVLVCHCARFGWKPEFPQMTMETFAKFYFIYIYIKQSSPLIRGKFSNSGYFDN